MPKKPKPQDHAVSAQVTGVSSVTPSATEIPYGGSFDVTWTMDQDYDQVAVLVTAEANATSVLDADFVAGGYTEVANQMLWVHDDYGFGGYDVPSVAFTLPDGPHAQVWLGGGADVTITLTTPTYVGPPTGSDRIWNTLATATLTVTG